MKIASKIAANTVFLIGHQSVSKVTGFLFLIFATRDLGAQGYGQFSFALAFTAFFYFLGNLGLHGVEIREGAKDHKRIPKLLFHSLLIRSVLSAVSFVLILIIAPFLAAELNVFLLIALMGLSVCLDSVAGAYYNALLAAERMNRAGLLIYGLVSFKNVFSILALITGKGLLIIASVWALSSLIFLIIAWRVVTSEFPLQKTLDRNLIKWLLREAWPFALSALIVTGYFRADVLIISLYRNLDDVGIYSAAYRIWDSIIFIPLAFLGALFPTLSRSLNESASTFRDIIAKAFKYLFIILIALFVPIVLLSMDIILTLFGNDFKASAYPLMILMISFPLFVLRQLIANILNVRNKQKNTLLLDITALALNLIINFIFVPIYGVVAAAFAMVFSELGTLAIGTALARQDIRSKSVFLDLFPAILGGIVMGLLLYTANNYLGRSVYLSFAYLASLLTFIGFLFLSKTLSWTELQIIKNIIKK